MPVRKFRRVEDMEAPVWRVAGDPELFRAMTALWEIGRRTRTRRYPPGVLKYASIDEMRRAQERWADDREDI